MNTKKIKKYSNKNTIITAIVFTIILHFSFFIFKVKEEKDLNINSNNTVIRMLSDNEKEKLNKLFHVNDPALIIKPNYNFGYSSLRKKRKLALINNIQDENFETKEYKYNPKLNFNVNKDETITINKPPALILKQNIKYPNIKSSENFNIPENIIDDEIINLLNEKVNNSTVLEISNDNFLPRIKIKQSSGNFNLDKLLIKKLLKNISKWNKKDKYKSEVWFNWSKNARRWK